MTFKYHFCVFFSKIRIQLFILCKLEIKLAASLTISHQNTEAFDKKRMLPGNLLREAREQLQFFDPIPEASFAAKPQGNLKMPRGDFTVETATRLCKVEFY